MNVPDSVMMSSAATSTEGSSVISVRSLHLMTLCSFAITGPLLTAFARQTVYIYDQQFQWLEIGVLLTVLTVVIPSIFVTLDQLLGRWSRFVRGYGRNLAFTVLFGVIVLSLLRPYLAADWIMLLSVGGLFALMIAIPAAFLATFLYVRTGWMKTWLTFASIGIVVFPAIFAWQFHSIRQAEKSMEGAPVVKNPVPVVFVVFDEFTSVTLMNEQMEIDAARFPQFARLAGTSTWYRNMTTNHPRTDVAVPTLLSGNFPTTDRSPLAAEYPGNLLQIMDSTKLYETAVFEPVSRLNPGTPKFIRAAETTSAQRCLDLLHTLAAVYPRLIFTSDTPVWFPVIPRSWFGVRDLSAQRYVELQKMTEGVFNYPGSEDRRTQLEHFLHCLKPSERPRFCFLHTVFPHHPWTFLPGGEQYLAETAGIRFPTGATGELGEDWHDDPPIVYRNQQRYRAQVGYADRFIGQILDRLEDAGILNRCLLVVTADHGVSFRPGHSRRLPDAETLPEILSVPLFIKFPGQSAGMISDRNVESVDILPTIADVLGIELPAPVDGTSVTREPARLRKSFFFERSMTVVEANVPPRVAAVKRQAALFGDRELEQPARESINHPDWLGLSLKEFTIEDRPVPFVSLDPLNPGTTWDHPDPQQTATCLVMGELNPSDLPVIPADLIVVVDGTILDSGSSYLTDQRNQTFEFLLPKSASVSTSNPAAVYLVDQSDGRLRLRPLKAVPNP